MAAAAKYVIIIFFLIAGSIIVFISQSYAPLILWLLSYLMLFGSVISGSIFRNKKERLIYSLLSSIVISLNCLTYIPYGSPTMILYGIGLIALMFVVVFLIAEIVSGLSQERHLKAE